jgi:hypothetical protein
MRIKRGVDFNFILNLALVPNKMSKKKPLKGGLAVSEIKLVINYGILTMNRIAI